MTRSRTAGLAAALLFVFLWASSFVPSKIASVHAPPLWFLILRFVTAAAIFTAIALALHLRFPATARRWATIAAVGVFVHAAYLGLSYEALRHLSSAMGAILACTNPLILAAIAPRLLGEPLTVSKASGLALGFGGVVLIMLARAGSAAARPYDVMLTLLGVVALVIGTTLFKRMEQREPLVVVNAIAFAAGALTLLPVAAFVEGVPHVVVDAPLLGAFAYLVVALSLGTTMLWFWLLSHGEASRVAAYYFLAPVFGIALGAALLHEAVVPRDAVGLACIVGGLVLVNRPANVSPVSYRSR